MISYKSEEGIFNFRVAAVIIHNNKVLLHRDENDNFWALPGGRCEMLEFSKDTIQREMQEEINEKINVNKLLWIVENIFNHKSENNHEIGLYYSANFVEDSPAINQDEFFGIENTHKLVFKWFDLDTIKDVTIYPIFLREKLNLLPQDIEQIMINQIDEFCLKKVNS